MDPSIWQNTAQSCFVCCVVFRGSRSGTDLKVKRLFYADDLGLVSGFGKVFYDSL